MRECCSERILGVGMDTFQVIVYPEERILRAPRGANLLELMREAGLAPEAPCGGNGSCGKCLVAVDGQERLACQTTVERDISVRRRGSDEGTRILTSGSAVSVPMAPCREGPLLAFDIGTTTVVCFLLDGSDGRELAVASMLNPQSPYGADVISRIQAAQSGQREALTAAIRDGMAALIGEVCAKAGIDPAEIGVVSVVANPCMQQLFLGMPVDNLAAVPFAPAICRTELRPAGDYLPACQNALLLVVPNIAGYIGSDTVGCAVSSRLFEDERITLMIDIGTNGEMILGNKDRMTSCSTAAGPALEGAKIRKGMRGAPGAIDHVWMDKGELCCSVIGGGAARGICGSGLIDAVAVLLKEGIINKRGRMAAASDNPAFSQRLREREGQRCFYLTDEVYLTQDDIREVQLAKGAIAAGIALMAEELGLDTAQIDRVLLAGAFGSFISPESACAIGLLPAELLERVTAIGNAAGSGAKMIACSKNEFALTDELIKRIEFIELAALPGFRRAFALCMNFS